jgi:hypothetical protein
MAQALVTAELLADHIVRALGSGDVWLEAFEAERRGLLRDYRLLTRFVLTLADYPKLARLALSAFAARPAALSHLVGVAGGVRGLMGPPFGAVRRAQM